MAKVVTVDGVMDATRNDELLHSGLEFQPDRKRALLEFFKSIGLSDANLMELGRHLQCANDSVPQGYLNFAEDVVSESFGGLIHKYRMLLLAYTPFPYSQEESAKLIEESLDRIIDKYHRSGLAIQYSTKINPSTENFGELLTIGSFTPHDYGMIDIVDGTKLLLNEGLFSVNFFEMLRANSDFLEFRVVFEPRTAPAAKAKPQNTDKATLGKLRLDISSPEPYLRYKENELGLNSSSIEYFVLKELLEVFPNAALDENIVSAWGGKDKPQTLYDASRRINKKLAKLLGIEGKPLTHKNSKFWFDERYKHLIDPLIKSDKT
ncbi:MAG TPA: hypothetical protein VGF75_02695 [Candidatus Saccharimonadales bacterium]|jgi:hypothetical protein